MTVYLGEVLGTALLMLLGNGVVANVVLKRTKGEGSGWIVITLGWGMAVFVAVAVVAPLSGGHINPAVTVALAAAGSFPWSDVLPYIAAQLLGAAIGTTTVFFMYRHHFEATEDPDLKLAVFCTAPAIRSFGTNLLCEVAGTFVLVLAVLKMASPGIGLGALDAYPVALVVLAIGLSLGGTTGYAINPARDLAPRVMHALLPVPDKRDSDWSYAWIPVLGPIAGGLIAAAVNRLF